MSRSRRGYRGAMSGLPSSKPFDRVDFLGSRIRRMTITLNRIERLIEYDVGEFTLSNRDEGAAQCMAEALLEIREQIKVTLKQEKIDANT